MATWCIDPISTAVTGTIQFKKPFKTSGDWLDDQELNGFPIEAMKTISEAIKHLGKEKKRWSEKDRQYFVHHMEQLQAARETTNDRSPD